MLRLSSKRKLFRLHLRRRLVETLRLRLLVRVERDLAAPPFDQLLDLLFRSIQRGGAGADQFFRLFVELERLFEGRLAAVHLFENLFEPLEGFFIGEIHGIPPGWPLL